MQNNQEVKTISSYEHSMRPVQIDNHIDLAGKMSNSEFFTCSLAPTGIFSHICCPKWTCTFRARIYFKFFFRFWTILYLLLFIGLTSLFNDNNLKQTRRQGLNRAVFDYFWIKIKQNKINASFLLNHSITARSEIRRDSQVIQNDAKVQELISTDQDLQSQIQKLTDDVDSNSHNINIISVRVSLNKSKYLIFIFSGNAERHKYFCRNLHGVFLARQSTKWNV